MKTIIAGLPYFARKLAQDLSEFDRDNTYIGIGIDSGIFTKLKYAFHLLTADIVYLMGGTATNSKLTALALLMGKKLVMHWVGSDALKAIKAHEENSICWRIVNRATHLAESIYIQKELLSIGINAEMVYFFNIKEHEIEAYKMPDTFSILTYVGEGREEFYGIDKYQRLAGDFPEIEIKIAGICTYKKELPSNVKLLGWIDNMDEHYKDCVLFLRLIEHDGFSFSVREALARGRYVGYSYKIANTFYINDYTTLKNLVSDLYRKHKGGKLPANTAGVDFIKENFSSQKVLSNLAKRLTKVRYPMGVSGMENTQHGRINS